MTRAPLDPFAVELAKARGKKYVVNFETGCWEWFGRLQPGGYAAHSYGAATRKYVGSLVHRFHYWEKFGELPDTLDHLCRVRHCVNPDHLEPVSRGENVRRGKNAKVNWDLVSMIRQSSLSNKDLAILLEVAACTISQIRNGHTWKEEHRP